MTPSTSAKQCFYLTSVNRVFELRCGRLRLGRASDCDLRTSNICSSRHHCDLIVRNDRLFVRDLGSTNGTFVNGQPVEFAELKVGDVLSVAGESFMLDLQRRAVWARLVKFTQIFARLPTTPVPARAAFSGSV